MAEVKINGKIKKYGEFKFVFYDDDGVVGIRTVTTINDNTPHQEAMAIHAIANLIESNFENIIKSYTERKIQ